MNHYINTGYNQLQYNTGKVKFHLKEAKYMRKYQTVIRKKILITMIKKPK